ncbi:MAG: hypothetical protein KA354_14360 [Phycisphaerae bacterium]|nr:hypothetical protein [Phycisphaerae bacterium]
MMWSQYLQWSDGRREVRPLLEMLDLPNGGRLWFEPRPGAPQPGLAPHWSTVGRKQWLEGKTPDAAGLFHCLSETIRRFVVLPDEDAAGACATVALWTMLTYCFPAWPAVPYLHITGPLGSGKTRLLEVLSRLVWRPTLASSLTAGVLYRTLHESGGTFLLDENERLAEKGSQASELRTALLAGYKAGGHVHRLQKDGDGFRAVQFDVYGPKAMGSIGDLPPALASRCIQLRMLRARGDHSQVQARLDADPEVWQGLRDDLHAFTLTHAGEIVRVARAQDELTRTMSGRDAELWRPLFALAVICERASAVGLVSGLREFAGRAVDIGLEDAAPEPDETLLTVLAECVIWQQTDVTPKDVLERAKKTDPVTFSRWTPHRVASVLKRYGVLTHKTGGGRRSYHRVTVQQLSRVASRYGLCIPLENAPIATNATWAPPNARRSDVSPSSALSASGDGGNGGGPGGTGGGAQADVC